MCHTISSSLFYYKLVHLIYETSLAAVSATTTSQPNVCDTISSSSLCQPTTAVSASTSQPNVY